MYVCLWPITNPDLGVTKLVSEHDLTVDDGTCVRHEADSLLVTDVTMG